MIVAGEKANKRVPRDLAAWGRRWLISTVRHGLVLVTSRQRPHACCRPIGSLSPPSCTDAVDLQLQCRHLSEVHRARLSTLFTDYQQFSTATSLILLRESCRRTAAGFLVGWCDDMCYVNPSLLRLGDTSTRSSDVTVLSATPHLRREARCSAAGQR